MADCLSLLEKVASCGKSYVRQHVQRRSVVGWCSLRSSKQASDVRSLRLDQRSNGALHHDNLTAQENRDMAKVVDFSGEETISGSRPEREHG